MHLTLVSSVRPVAPFQRSAPRGCPHARRCLRPVATSQAKDAGPQEITHLPHRRLALLGGIALCLLSPSIRAAGQTSENTPRTGEVQHSEEEWRKLLAPASYRVLRQGGTELPASSPLNREKRPGTFRCGGCNAALFASSAKFESGTGWPSFTEAVDNAITELPDNSIPFYARTEVRCKRCGGHIGHVFQVIPAGLKTRREKGKSASG